MTAPARLLPRTDMPDLARFRRYLTALGDCSPGSADTYCTHVRPFVNWFTVNRPGTPLLEATADDIEDYVMDLDERGLSSSTRRGAVYGLRKFYDWHGRAHVGFVNPAKAVKAPKQVSAPDPWDGNELSRLLRAPLAISAKHPHGSAKWVRAQFDHAVLATFRYTGLRMSEVLQIDTARVHLTRRKLEVVKAKGGRQRHLTIPKPLVPILDYYLREVRPLCPPSPRLFANPDGYDGSAVHGKLAPRAAFDIIRKYANLAGLEGTAHPHRVRHSYAKDLWVNGVALNAISGLLGHKNIITTIRYLSLTDDDLQAVVDDHFDDDHFDPGVADAHQQDIQDQDGQQAA